MIVIMTLTPSLFALSSLSEQAIASFTYEDDAVMDIMPPPLSEPVITDQSSDSECMDTLPLLSERIISDEALPLPFNQIISTVK